MKRLLVVLICICCVLLTGCGQDAATSAASSGTKDAQPNSSSSDTYEGELKIRFSFGTRTGNYSGQINEDGLPNGQGVFSSENTDGNKWTYEGDWEAGHWEGVGTTTWSNGETYSGEYFNDSEHGHGTFTFETGEKYEGDFLFGNIYGDGTLYYADGAKLVGTFTDIENASGTYYDSDGFSYRAIMEDQELRLHPTNDFFSDEERQNQYKTLYQSYQYSALAEYVNTYLSSNEVTPRDSAYAILELINPVIEYESQWNVSFDEFDSSYTVTFPGADSISGSNSVAVSVKGTNLDIKVGFRRNDWLFFDTIALSVNGEEVDHTTVKSYDVTRNVISGSTVEEYCSYRLYDDDLEQLKGAETVIIRFSNSESKEVYDHTLSQSEINALYCGMLLQRNSEELLDLLFHYNED